MNRIGKDSLLREIQTVDQKNIDKNTALRARHYLGMHTLDEVRLVSNGAAAFYVWVIYRNLFGFYTLNLKWMIYREDVTSVVYKKCLTRQGELITISPRLDSYQFSQPS